MPVGKPQNSNNKNQINLRSQIPNKSQISNPIDKEGLSINTQGMACLGDAFLELNFVAFLGLEI
jgi:hypothetical protein